MIRITVDPKAVLGNLSDIETKQLPFAVSLALNRVANLGQRAEQTHIKGAMRLRREAFVLRGVKIEKQDRANKSTWRVVIQVAAPQDFLNRAEQGEDHLPHKNKYLWMPNAAVFNNKIITRNNPMHPMNIRFVKHGEAMRAPNGVFMVKNSNGTPVVLQRVAKGARGVAQTISRGGLKGARGRDAQGRMTSGGAVKGIRRGGVRQLYTLVSRSRTPARLEFVHTITRTVNEAWNAEMTRALGDSLKAK